jgi:ribosomal protein S12 methylthiotransferase
METQAAISESKLAAKVGRTLEVLIDEVQDGTALGRSHADAPEIDGTVSVAGKGLKVGQRVKAKITHADTYDLFGEVVS